jgi:glycosyltransferase involved in cell wall biosynthesis
MLPLVSVIVPAHNCASFLRQTLDSVLGQVGYPLEKIELSIVDDASTDGTSGIIDEYEGRFSRLVRARTESPRGPGGARNLCILQSHGEVLVFLDSDDVMMPNRVAVQVRFCLSLPEGEGERTLIGGRFIRIPVNATLRYTDWCNGLTDEDLYTQQYRENTIILPTWCCRRAVFDRAGPFKEGVCVAEDLIFFHRHLELGGRLARVPEFILGYTLAPGSVTSGTARETLVRIRVQAVEDRVIRNWDRFTIWGAGRDGKHFYSMLSPEAKQKVAAMADVDVKKINSGGWVTPTGRKIPVIRWEDMTPPVITCVALDRTDGQFEKNVQATGLTPGLDLIYFN